MPLAWVDEVAGLEPAVNFSQGRGFTSKLWPYDGVEELFLAYLPLQGWLHIIFQSILDFSVYGVRLPYALFLVTGGLFWFSYMKSRGSITLVTLFILILILNEKSLFETTRAVRVEPISFLLLAAAFYGIVKSNKHIVSIALSLMLFLHPNMWPSALILFIWIGRENSLSFGKPLHWLEPNIYWIYPTVFLCFFLLFIEGNISLLFSQLIAQFERHEASLGLFTKISDHFVTRFWPYYLTQPFVPLLVYFTFFRSTHRISRQTGSVTDYMLVFTHICWMLAIGPMHRYNSVLVILSLATLIPWLATIHQDTLKWKHYLLAGIIFTTSMVDVSARQILARVQYEERNPTSFIEWLDTNMPKGKSIVTGHEIAYYQAAQNNNLDFFLYNTEPYRFNFEDYENLLLIHNSPLDNTEVMGYYSLDQSAQPNWVKNNSSLTYNNLYLLRINNTTEYRTILNKLRKKNTEKSNKERYN